MSSAAAMRGDIPGRGALADSADFFDVLLETLSYLTDSAWGGFEFAVEVLDGEFGSNVSSARDAARVLSALGHIDVQLDRRTLRPVAWSVSPPTLLPIAAQEWLLCGRRASSTLAAVIREAERQGIRAMLEPVSGQPTRIVLRSLDDPSPETIEAIAAAVREGGHEILVNTRGAADLARALPTLAGLLDCLQRSVPAAGGAVERLDHDGRGGLKWSRVVDFSSRGAYRFDPPPITYVYVDRDAAVPIRVDPRLARLLALLAEGMAPLAWDPSTGTATAMYYAEPPPLYERALGLSSGYGPQPSPYERRTQYRGVSEEIAVAVYSRLSAWKASASR
jgi:hypothetical protein